MKVTFIEHSGLWLRWNKMFCCLITIREKSRHLTAVRLYVFASHSHADHYDPAIWKLKEQYKDIHYILSDDIKDNEDAVVMKAHEKRKLLESK